VIGESVGRESDVHCGDKVTDCLKKVNGEIEKEIRLDAICY
jgi:copper chaperone CopZ